MTGLEDKTINLAEEAFDSLLDSMDRVQLEDDMLATQLEQFKIELQNLKSLSKHRDAELADTQDWLRYSLEQFRHDLPPYIVHRFYTLFALLRTA